MRFFVLLIWLVMPLSLMAEEMEIMELRHRLVDDVLPVLQPLLEPHGVMTGMGNQLVVRTSARNLEEIRRVLAVVDQPHRRLLIRVNQSRNQRDQERSLGLSTQDRDAVTITDRLDARPAARLTVRGDAQQGRMQRQTHQSVQVLDGSPALIHVGRSLAVPMRRRVRTAERVQVTERVEYVEIGQGFYATPRLTGNQVTVEITPYSKEVSSRGDGHVDTRQMSTTVSGQLGQWLEVGVSSSQTAENRSSIAGVGSGASSDQQSIWLRIDEVP